MNQPFYDIDSFVGSTKDVVYLRQVDRLMIIRPNKIQHLNDSAFEMLGMLYEEGKTANETVVLLSEKYNEPRAQVTRDLTALVRSINAIMQEDYGSACMIENIPYDPGSVKYPVLSEIALTYRCQNRCDFCYASSPYRGEEFREMATAEVKEVIQKIHRDAHVPTISFTGGEPTLRKDLPELVAYANGLGMRTNLITNGIRCSDVSLVRDLSAAGLKSAQVSLESHNETIHNEITGNSSAHADCVAGIKNLKEAGVYTHTNTTICQKNKDFLFPLVKFIKDEFDAPYLSMNMIINTGIACDNDNIKIGYSTIGSIVQPVIDYCETLGVKFVWYSPTPYCLFNPVDYGLGSKSCACVSGLLSVNPAGDILPCSSFDRGIGSLLKSSFEYVWNSDPACYWREKRYIPPVCKKCDMKELCAGACPLYWERAGSFEEIEAVRGESPRLRNALWNVEKRVRIKSKGVKGVENG
ncbi:MAG: radical SAM protein [bacterium]|nr:radical SAM protein [bacterium]